MVKDNQRSDPQVGTRILDVSECNPKVGIAMRGVRQTNPKYGIDMPDIRQTNPQVYTGIRDVRGRNPQMGITIRDIPPTSAQVPRAVPAARQCSRPTAAESHLGLGVTSQVATASRIFEIRSHIDQYGSWRVILSFGAKIICKKLSPSHQPLVGHAAPRAPHCAGIECTS